MRLWQFIADTFPTQFISQSRPLAGVWRFLFYVARPRKPFHMRTADYRFLANPARDSLSRTVIRRGTWEASLTEAMRNALKPGDRVIDAGANFGHFTMTAAARVGAGGGVYAFEPNPRTFQELLANASMQPHRNIRCKRVALGDQNHKAQLFLDDKNPGGHTLERDLTEVNSRSTEVSIDTIDSLIEDGWIIGPIAYLKSDCQGADAKVLRGGWQMIARDRPTLSIEFWPAGIRRFGDDPDLLFSDLLALGYRVAMCDGETVLPTTLAQVHRRTDGNPKAHVDLIFSQN